MAVKGELMPFKMDMSQDFVVDLGNCQEGESASALAQGIDVVNQLSFGSSWPFQVGFSDNKMSVSANITNSDNELVATVRNNTWKSLSPSSLQIGDRNYNDYAFEVVDTNMVPIFNIRVVGPNEIQIGGLFDIAGGQVLISDNGGGILTTPSTQNISELLTPIFKYPSSQYLGELVNPTYLKSLPTDTSNTMMLEASVVTIFGYILLGVGTMFLIISEVIREKDNQKDKSKATENQLPTNNKPKKITKRQKNKHRFRRGRKR